MDEQLTWRAFQSGSSDAFATIYSTHYEALLNYGLRFCKDEEVVEDNIQDLFIELWQSRRDKDHIQSVRFYLLKSLRYKLSLHYQRQKIFVFPGEDAIVFEAEFSFEASLIARQAEEESYQLLLKTLNNLTPRQKEILYLRFFNNLDYDQVAQVTGLSYQSARNQLSLALKAMKKEMNVQWNTIFMMLALVSC